MRERKKVTAAVIYKNQKVLVAQRGPNDNLANKWEFPGGKVEGCETPEACLKREIMEELGIEIKVGKYLCSSFFDYDHISIELMAFACEVVTGEACNKEHQSLLWIEPMHIRTLDMAPADLPVVEHILGKEFKGVQTNTFEKKEDPDEHRRKIGWETRHK